MSRTNKEVSVIETGTSNLASVCTALKRVGAQPQVTCDKQAIAQAQRIVIPGVGAFKDAIRNLTHLKENVLTLIEEGRPLLGICLGLHMLFSTSTEGGLTKGLDYFKGRVIRLPQELTVPHMGWNSLKILSSIMA